MSSDVNSELRNRGPDGTRRFQVFDKALGEDHGGECGHGVKLTDPCAECLKIHQAFVRATGEK